MRRRLLTFVPIAAAVVVTALLVLPSCYPNQPENVTDLDVVVTLYDPEMDFTTINTYALPDTIIHFFNEDEKNPPDLSRDPVIERLILNEVRKNMNQLQYTEITNPGPGNVPDVVVHLAATATNNYSAYTTYDWYGSWGWYWGWGVGGPGWGVGYPWAGSGGYYTTVYNYPVGTLFIDMFYSAGADPDAETVPSIWVGALNGVLSSKDAQLAQQRLVWGINRAFEQSEYLGK